MQIVIDIPDYDYRQIKEYYEKNDTVEATYSYIYHGTPLPKGHGRLIDADALAEKLHEVSENHNYKELTMSVDDVFEAVIADLKGTGVDGFENNPTIIEADKAESEG